ncbi:hypothetical protein HG536_0B05770 [Torulaspora globosa]|uniref:Uncharacterized protein n=1 Tax=Torulaspora globosa TaxID=48254 RepID=A0A7G3ZDX6_9SACH|nr:uncharacterized protein HG536_0B05770 [Torulaspora globosa]QLL31712.1 hypothetical protein HG536_0B05770 [Torulaspora globosa]
MKPKIGGRVWRGKTLGDKDINTASAAAYLDKKQFKGFKNDWDGKENTEPNIAQKSDIFSEEADLTAILEQKFDERSGPFLTSENLATLQNELIKREVEQYCCGHPLCSINNRRQIPLRLWFLFELEMLEDSGTNFRNLCYHNQVYREIDREWKMQNLLQNQHIPSDCEFFPIQQLKIHDIELDRNHEESTTGKLQAGVENLIEKDDRKLLPTLLSKRNMRSVFDHTPVRASKILSTELPSDSADLQETSTAQKERKCMLLNKLSLLHGCDSTKHPDK